MASASQRRTEPTRTMKEVAARAGVSVGTVSNVISGAAPVSEDLRERVTKAIRELQYHPNHVARSLKSNRTRMLGMVISDIANPFFPLVMRGAEEAALEHNYAVVTLNSDSKPERERHLLAILNRYRVDGVLLVLASDRDLKHVKTAADNGTPFVFLDRVPEGIECDSVSVDNAAGARKCVRHLLERGHRRIGMIAGSPTLHISDQRLAGYREALEAAGVPHEPSLVGCGNFRLKDAWAATLELLRRPDRPTALFVANNEMAVGALHAIQELRLRCPQDVALVVFDDMPFFELTAPPITALAQPSYALGYQGAELLIRRIEGKLHASTHIMLDTRLNIRQSSGGTSADSMGGATHG